MVRILSLFALSFFSLISFSTFALQVTFSVNMQNQVVSAEGVHMEGNFQDVDGDGVADNPQLYDWVEGGISLFDQDGDGIYSIALDIVPGKYFYTFSNGLGVGSSEDVPTTCRVGTYRNYRAAIITQDVAMPTVCFGECANCGELAARLVVDATSTALAGAEGVSVVGDFEGGANQGIPMIEGAFGHFWTVVTVPPSGIHYSFVDGSAGAGVETATNDCMSAGVRSLSQLSADTILSPVCFNACTTCFPQTEVLFRVDMSHHIVAYEGVFLAGQMNEWIEGQPQYKFTDPDGDSIYELLVTLYHGTYNYKTINGYYDFLNPFASEFLPSSCSTNGNRVYETTSVTDTVEYCFNQCIGVCEDWPAPTPVTFKVDLNNEFGGWANLHIASYSSGVAEMFTTDSPEDFEITLMVPGPAEVKYYFSNDAHTNEFESLTGCDPTGNFLGRIIDRTQLTSPVLNHCFGMCQEECPLVYGCVDMSACNYNESADVDDGSCIPASECTGCNDSSANNYEPGAIFSDGSCLFNYYIQVFEDLNSNGSMDAGELPVENIAFESQGQIFFSDASGQVAFMDMPADVFSATLQLSAPWINCTTPMSAVIGDLGGGSIYFFGINQEVPNAAINVSVMVEGENICDTRTFFYLHIDNIGNTAVTVDVNAMIDTLYTFEYSPVWNELSGDTLSFYNIGANAGDGFSTYLITTAPSFLYLGDTAHHSFEFIISANGLPFDTVTVDYENEILCAYDPNDKTVLPAGYRDEHFILADQELKYRVRFQNTGNASAGRVVVRDVIDEGLDLSTFQLLHTTHNYEVEIDQLTREVSVIFDDINLPSSMEDEPGSHGQFEYIIHTASDVQALDRIENTAFIYFDLNPPIITNTTWNTIFDCALMPTLDSEGVDVCIGFEVPVTVDSSYVEMFTWSVNDVLVTQEDTLWYEGSVSDESIITLEVTNPLCTVQSQGQVIVHDLPEAAFLFLTDHLQAIEPGILFTWILNGEVLQSSESPIMYISESGSYTLEVLSEFGCLGKFTNSVILGVDESTVSPFVVYPNPASDVIFIKENAAGAFQFEVFDVLGKKMETSLSVGTSFQIETSDWPMGVYNLRIFNEQVSSQHKVVVQH